MLFHVGGSGLTAGLRYGSRWSAEFTGTLTPLPSPQPAGVIKLFIYLLIRSDQVMIKWLLDGIPPNHTYPNYGISENGDVKE